MVASRPASSGGRAGAGRPPDSARGPGRPSGGARGPGLPSGDARGLGPPGGAARHIFFLIFFKFVIVKCIILKFVIVIVM